MKPEEIARGEREWEDAKALYRRCLSARNGSVVLLEAIRAARAAEGARVRAEAIEECAKWLSVSDDAGAKDDLVLICGGTFWWDHPVSNVEPIPNKSTVMARWDEREQAWKGDAVEDGHGFFWYLPEWWKPVPAPKPSSAIRALGGGEK